MTKSFRRKNINLSVLFLFAFTCLILAGCSKSDDQKRFEEEALRAPQNITETGPGGKIIENKEDPDDWRISPMYQSLIFIGEPRTLLPNPNPVGYNDRIILELYLGSIETLSSITIFAFDSMSQNTGLNITRSDLSSSNFISIEILGQDIAGGFGGSNASGLYRILISDGRNNIITYGDVQIGRQGTP